MTYDPPPLHLGANTPDVRWQALSNVAVRPLRWVEKPFLQGNAFTLLAGKKNAGKGTLLANLAARITRGQLPAGRRVIWLAGGEDSYAVDIRPRIEIAGGDVDLVTVPTMESDVTLPTHLDALKTMMGVPGDVGLVVIDPLGGMMGNGRSSNSDTDVRPMLRALNLLADEYQTMVFGSRNVSIKADALKNGALGSILGSTSWVDLPRAVLMLFHDPIDSDLRHLHIMSGNRSRSDQAGLMLRIEGIVPPWGGEEITRMLAVGQSLRDPDELLAPRRASKSAEAEGPILAALLRNGDMESSMLDTLVAQDTGLAARTIRNIRFDRLLPNGLIRHFPEKSPNGQVERWRVDLTEAGRVIAEATNPPSPDSLTPRTGDPRDSGDADMNPPAFSQTPLDPFNPSNPP